MMSNIFHSIKECGRQIFGSNYVGHRKAVRTMALLLGLPLLFITPWFAFLISTVLVWAVMLMYEIRDHYKPGNYFSKDDLYGNTRGAVEALILGYAFIGLLTILWS